jgi:catechol 2,3-dioxygenase-like lactoylglutathione lyase family enzyme
MPARAAREPLSAVFDHVGIRVFDRPAAERFYRSVLAALEIEPSHAETGALEWEDFSIAAADAEHPSTRNLHLAFVAPSRAHVDSFWRAGLEIGAPDDGEPGERPQYTPGYYGAFLRDPDGNSAEAVTHRDVRRGGHIDHLWIRVGDLDAASLFYSSLAPHLGLREGRRWVQKHEQGRQFRGAWATFSLVADDAPPTAGLHIAFPAPDRQTVRDFHDAAIRGGHAEVGPPAERRCRGGSRGSGLRYSARVIDPAGTVVESACPIVAPARRD